MAGKHDKRLAKVEQSLTPKQAVLRWMQEALGHPSLEAAGPVLRGKACRRVSAVSLGTANGGRGPHRPQG